MHPTNARLRLQQSYRGGNRFHRMYGYEPDQPGRRRRPRASEQDVIPEIRAACSQGRGYAKMARTLNARVEPTVSGAEWSTSVVRKLAL
jgi:hypothetical protein